ncbi:MAG: hypothetical protein U0412_03840 [Nitrospira sp.]
MIIAAAMEIPLQCRFCVMVPPTRGINSDEFAYNTSRPMDQSWATIVRHPAGSH